MRTLVATLVLVASCAGAPSAAPAPPTPPGAAVAVFAGGCFWCMESEFDDLPGVFSAVSGYAGGHVDNPTYEQVGTGRTGHAEAVQVTYDPTKASYDQLLDIYWSNVDPLDEGGQFCDRGSQYRAAIFPRTDEEKAKAEASKRKAEERLKAAVYVRIEPWATFWPAEAHHQDFAKTESLHYALYRKGCGRDARLREVWGPGAGH
jgi:peptide-methionine (S)-S-oxide reductase